MNHIKKNYYKELTIEYLTAILNWGTLYEKSCYDICIHFLNIKGTLRSIIIINLNIANIKKLQLKLSTQSS